MRIQLSNLVKREAENARNGIPSSVVIKLNSLQDKEFIDELYEASRAGVKIKLVVRGMCCLRPGRIPRYISEAPMPWCAALTVE